MAQLLDIAVEKNGGHIGAELRDHLLVRRAAERGKEDPGGLERAQPVEDVVFKPLFDIAGNLGEERGGEVGTTMPTFSVSFRFRLIAKMFGR